MNMDLEDSDEEIDFDVRPLTLDVYMALAMDEWPTPAGCLDFGLVSEQHYGALQYAVSDGVNPKELDAALGNGKRLTALIGPDNPYRGVTFRTAWDEIQKPYETHNHPEGWFDPQCGVCPDCLRNDGYRNVGKQHWFICDAHRYKWLMGEGVFYCWRSETDEEWEDNRKILDGYVQIEPVFPQSDK